MYKKSEAHISKVVALALAVVLLFGMFPVGAYSTGANGETIGDFSVNVTEIVSVNDETGEEQTAPAPSGIIFTMENTDNGEVVTATTNDSGTAVFSNIIYNANYKLKIGSEGYEISSLSNVEPTVDLTIYDINIKKTDSVTLSGTVKYINRGIQNDQYNGTELSGITLKCTEVVETATPEAGETATPEAGETATPEAGETATSEAGETATSEAGETATPEADETVTDGETTTATSFTTETDSDGKYKFTVTKGKKYIITVENNDNYNTYQSEEIIMNESQICDFDLEPKMVKISGTVTYGQTPIKGATVNCYQDGETTTLYMSTETDDNGTDDNGTYSFEVPKGKNYKLEVVPSEEYVEATATISNVNGNIEQDFALSLKTFEVNVSTNIDEGGTVTKSNESVTYNGDLILTVKPNEYYRIKNITISDADGSNQKTITGFTDDNGSNNPFNFTVSGITTNKKVYVEFEKINIIRFTIDGDGKVTFEDGSDINANAIEIIKADNPNSLTFTAKVNGEGYHIGDIKVNEESILTEDEKGNSLTSRNFEVEYSADKNEQTVEVTFSINTYKVTAKSASEGNGTVEIATEETGTKETTVKYNDSAKIMINPDSGYCIDKIKVNDVTIDLNDDKDKNNYTYTEQYENEPNITFKVNRVTKDTNVEVTFKKIDSEEISYDAFNKHYIKVTEGARNSCSDGKLICKAETELLVKGNLYNDNTDYPKGIYVSVKLAGEEDWTSWAKSYEISSSCVIEGIRVNSKSYGDVKEVTFEPSEPSLQIIIDSQPPQISGVTKYHNITTEGTTETTTEVCSNTWCNKTITLNVTVKDSNEGPNGEYAPSSGIARVVYSTEEKSVEDILRGAGTCKLKKNGTTDSGEVYSYTFEGECEKTIYLYAVDNSGNVSKISTPDDPNATPEETVDVDINIDKTKPVVTKIDFEPTDNNSAIEEVINFLSFGTFCKESIKVVVTAQDKGTYTSGLNNAVLYSIKNGVKTQIGNSDELSTNGTFEFEIAEENFDKFFDSEIGVEVTDNAQNTSECTKPKDKDVESPDAQSNKLTVSTEPPVIEISTEEPVYKDTNGNVWYSNNDVKYNVDVKANEIVGINSANVALNATEVATYNMPENATAPVAEKEFKNLNLNQVTTEGKNTITVKAVTNSFEEATATGVVYVDSKNPVILETQDVNGEVVNGFTFEYDENNVIKKVLNFLTFGTFFNEKVTITVTAYDGNVSDNKASGISKIKLYLKNDSGIETFEATDTITVNDNLYSATFEIPADEIITDDKVFIDNVAISAEVTDNVGHTSGETSPNSENSNALSENLTIETVKPTIEISTEIPEYTEKATTANGKKTSNNWYDSDTDFTVTATDENSGIKGVSIKINGTELSKDKNGKEIKADLYSLKEASSGETATQEQVTEQEFVVNTSQVKQPADGVYNIEVKVTDNAGNVHSDKKTVYKDITPPQIKSFDFTPANYSEGDKTDVKVEVTDYGFYFKQDTKVTVKADDDAPSSGVKYIEYYTVDINNKQSKKSYIDVDENNCISFIIGANFKGQIYAKAVDNVGNNSDFVTPNSTIVESPEKHLEDDHIAFVKEDTKYTANNSTELYNKDVPVTITVTDDYSGIRSIEWSVVAPYDTQNNKSGKVTVNNDKTFTEDSEQDWKQLKTDFNLVTQMQKTITVNNNSNDIVLKVKMTDRAGNTSEESIVFSIDKTAPSLTVEYDNSKPDSKYTSYYKTTRVATITVEERNFNPDNVLIDIDNTDNNQENRSGWEEAVNGENPDKSVYTMTIEYVADGDYTFDITCSDRANNYSADYKPDSFTIDKTIPTVSVSYSNDNASNGNYYNANRVATITITEHNFDSERVKITGKASDDGVSKKFPVESNWTSIGDRHIATINYTDDSKYSFDIEFTDMASNSIKDYRTEEFYIDKTKPTIIVANVENKGHYKDEIAPAFTFMDTNYNTDGLKVTLKGTSNGTVDYANELLTAKNGQRMVYENFEQKQSVDDKYILEIQVTDLAGNKITKEIKFSVNRFGSSYEFDDTFTKDIKNGKYITEGQDIIFVEKNPDNLSNIKIKVTKDDVPTDLEKDKDYTVSSNENDEDDGWSDKWLEYTYTIKKHLFADDGNYKVTVYSEDDAGNENSNEKETKKAEISFGIDKTDPTIAISGIQNGEQYAEETKTVTVNINDNLVLTDVSILLNNKEVKFDVRDNTYTFEIPESSEKQSVKILAYDKAGNMEQEDIDNIIVSTNMFVRWYNNTPLFVGSIIGFVVLAIGITAFILFGLKRKKNEDEI